MRPFVGQGGYLTTRTVPGGRVGSTGPAGVRRRIGRHSRPYARRGTSKTASVRLVFRAFTEVVDRTKRTDLAVWQRYPDGCQGTPGPRTARRSARWTSLS